MQRDSSKPGAFECRGGGAAAASRASPAAAGSSASTRQRAGRVAGGADGPRLPQSGMSDRETAVPAAWGVARGARGGLPIGRCPASGGHSFLHVDDPCTPCQTTRIWPTDTHRETSHAEIPTRPCVSRFAHAVLQEEAHDPNPAWPADNRHPAGTPELRCAHRLHRKNRERQFGAHRVELVPQRGNPSLQLQERTHVINAVTPRRLSPRTMPTTPPNKAAARKEQQHVVATGDDNRPSLWQRLDECPLPRRDGAGARTAAFLSIYGFFSAAARYTCRRTCTRRPP